MVGIKLEGIAKLVGTGLVAMTIALGAVGPVAGAHANRVDPGDLGGSTPVRKAPPVISFAGVVARLPHGRFPIGFLSE